ncbi:hypothetical protein BASA81_007281 [Batrachochytrium salamandrivorans]|nr:hypothetical protein BASA81_007281 [Batrachochytrium salamandrivorans]
MHAAAERQQTFPTAVTIVPAIANAAPNRLAICSSKTKKKLGHKIFVTMRRRPAGNFVIGAVVGGAVGGAVARHSVARQEKQYEQHELQQAQIAQAQAEANYANAQAQTLRAQQQQPVAEPMAYAQPTQQQQYYAPPPQQQQLPPPDLGRSMLNQALSEPGASVVQDLAYLQKQLKVTQLLCEQALGLYQQSMQLNQAAQRTNMTGALVGNLNRRSNAADLVMDQSRNSKMRASTEPAEKASQMLVDGFKRIPDALRMRYPQEMSRVGNVPAARLKVGSFGRDVLMGAAFGQTGNNLNDAMMAKKIADNQREIGECIQVVREQLQLMQIVQARLDQDMANERRGQIPTVTAVPSATPAVPPRPAPAAAAPPRPPPAAAMGQQQLVLRAPHLVDEVAMAPYGIISVPQGAVVFLVQGSLQTGLGGHFQDYIEVNYQGKVGKISRLIVAPSGAAPPPAIF